MAYTDIELILFIFAKEFGWNAEAVLNMENRKFRMYLRELTESYKAQQCAKDDKKYTRPRSSEISKKATPEVEELARRIMADKNASNLQD